MRRAVGQDRLVAAMAVEREGGAFLLQNTNNLEKELERTLELFKQLQYESKVDQLSRDLKEQIERQKELLKKTESLEKSDKSDKSDKNSQNQEDGVKNTKEGDNQELAKEQDSLLEESRKTSEKIEELKKLAEEI